MNKAENLTVAYNKMRHKIKDVTLLQLRDILRKERVSYFNLLPKYLNENRKLIKSLDHKYTAIEEPVYINFFQKFLDEQREQARSRYEIYNDTHKGNVTKNDMAINVNKLHNGEIKINITITIQQI